MSKIKAVALMSGGLDSMLSAKIVEQFNILVYGVNFYTGFCIVEQRRRIDGARSAKTRKKLENLALKSAAEIEIPIEIIDISKEYLKIVTNPKYGYGSNVNPCIDCRIHMLRKAYQYMKDKGAHFIVTGEVVGQRPMSQHKHTMRLIEKEANVEGLVLRPLSAKLLKPTIAEINGWVDREKLYDIFGRGRKRQIELAYKFNILDFPNASGGCCFLTDQTYAVRFFDLMKHRQIKDFTLNDVVRLRLGRHFRINDNYKIIIGRNERENELIEEYAEENMVILKSIDVKGPTTLLEGNFNLDDIKFAASLTAGYGKGKHNEFVEFEIIKNKESIDKIKVKPINPALYSQNLISYQIQNNNKNM